MPLNDADTTTLSLTKKDLNAPSVKLEDSRRLYATRSALLYADGDTILSRIPWAWISTMSWNGPSNQLTVRFTDPKEADIVWACVPGEPKSFLQYADGYLSHSVVLFRQITLRNGTQVHAQIRRAEDDSLLCIVTANGVVDPVDDGRVAALEAEVRGAVGLD